MTARGEVVVYRRGTESHRFDTERRNEYGVEYRALPVAEFDALKARAERAEALLREAREGLSIALDNVDWETTDHDIAITERLDATIEGIDAALKTGGSDAK